MKWKTVFKIALLHPFRMVWSLFDNDNHRIVSKAGQQQLQKQALIDMMKHDEELGLYIINDVTSMATLETQYKMYLEKNPDSKWTYDEWLKWHSEWLAESIKNIDPTISNDFQIGPDGAYEATEEFELYQKYTDEFAGYEDVPSYEWFKHELENNETFRKRYGKDNTRI